MPIDVSSPASTGLDERDFLSLLQACLACGVLIVTDQLRLAGINPLAKAILGIESDQILDQPIEVLPANLAGMIRETSTTGTPVTGRQLSLQPDSRERTLLQVTTALFQDGASGRSGIVVILNDVSSIRGWESNVRRLDRLHSVGTLSASMAHEVKNAFVAVRTFVDLLLEKNKEVDLADVVRQEMDRIDSILSQMLKFSRTDKPSFTTVHLHAILDKSLHLIQHLLVEKNIRIDRAFNASSDLFNGDANQLEQAFINLCFNAVDAMRSGGHLSISTEVLPPGTAPANIPLDKSRAVLRLVIRDDGTGIALKDADHLFEPFFTTKPEGTGLGLPITRRIIQDHGGVITAESKPGEGSAFSIFLPTIRSEQPK